MEIYLCCVYPAQTFYWLLPVTAIASSAHLWTVAVCLRYRFFGWSNWYGPLPLCIWTLVATFEHYPLVAAIRFLEIMSEWLWDAISIILFSYYNILKKRFYWFLWLCNVIKSMISLTWSSYDIEPKTPWQPRLALTRTSSDLDCTTDKPLILFHCDQEVRISRNTLGLLQCVSRCFSYILATM